MPGQNILSEKKIDLEELSGILWSNKIFISLITALAIIIGANYVVLAKKKFTATVIFQIEEKNSNGFNVPTDIGALASLAGLSSEINSSADALLERIVAREFIMNINKKLMLSNDPFFNTYNPEHVDPLWKKIIKKLIGWTPIQAKEETIIENRIIGNYKNSVIAKQTGGGAIALSVIHSKPQLASQYANMLMEEIRLLVELENQDAQERRLSYLSSTLADSLQEMEVAQQNLKEFALRNSAQAQENFIKGSLKLDELRMERRKVYEISELLSLLYDMIKKGEVESGSYEALRLRNPLVDDVNFRRILGMSETISAWSWPDINTIDAVKLTLNDRIKRLDVEITNIEGNAKIYATSAEDLNKLTRDSKIAEATYTVLIEQVKAQTLAAGFNPNTFKVFEYATPPLAPSSPKRILILALSALSGFLTGCIFSLANASRKKTFYTKSSILSEIRPNLVLDSRRLKKIARMSISKLLVDMSKHKKLKFDEAEIKLGNKKLIYILNCGGRTTASDTARVLATQSSTSGRRIAILDQSYQSINVGDETIIEKFPNLCVVENHDNIDILKDERAYYFFTALNFSSTIEELIKSYDQVFICTDNENSLLGLMALKSFEPCLVALTRLRKTKRLTVNKIKSNQPVDILFYE